MENYRLVKMSNSSIKDPEMIMSYASLGYFHYHYIKTLTPTNSGENLVKDNGTVRGSKVHFKSGSYLQVSIADFKGKRKISCVFWFEHNKVEITVEDLISLCNFIYKSMSVNESDCFVKFDVSTVVDD